MGNVRENIQRINIPDYCIRDEPMSLHTSFQIGGPADLFCTPETIKEVRESINLARDNSLPYFVLGEGANVLVADKGIRGMVINLSRLSEYTFTDTVCTALAGVPVTRLAEAAQIRELSGIEFLYSLPGSLGGAIYMNARCYGKSIADVVSSITYLTPEGRQITLLPEKCEFTYKSSCFQYNKGTVVQASFQLHRGIKSEIVSLMGEYRKDRAGKGHFSFPSAGSVFKNNRNFGKPTGMILDSLDLRSLQIGGAQISPFHANIIVNTGDAKASDVCALIKLIKTKVREAYGYELEEEIRYLGEWD